MWSVTLPGQVGELGVHRAGDHLCVDGTKLMHTITERYDLSRADKRAAKEGKQTHLHRNALGQSTSPVRQMKRLCSAHLRCYSQVQGIEEEDKVFAFVV